jgi:O-antigen/teichoic acid export membrane protein
MPMILVNTFFPMLARAHAADARRFEILLQRLMTIVTWGGLVTGAGLTLVAPWLVQVLYGPAFAATAGVIMISGWSGVFAGQGAVRAQWLLFSNLQRFGLYYVSLGAGLNVLLNALFIPGWGGKGAAMASLATQASVVLLAPLLFSATRPSFRLLANAFFLTGLNLRQREP